MKRLFLWAWGASHLLYFWAFTYTFVPNQIHFAYTGALLLLGWAIFPSFAPVHLDRKRRGAIELAALVGLYIVALWVVSIGEAIPGTAAPYFRFETIHMAVALNAYLVGRIVSQRQLFTLHGAIGLALMAATILQLTLDRDQVRYGYGVQMMLCIPAMLLLGWRWAAVGALLVVLASLHKTSLACALLAATVVYWKGQMPPATGNRYVRAALPLFASVLVAAALTYLLPMIGSTVERLLPEGLEIYGLVGERTDAVRSRVYDLSFDLLPDYWPWGMGYMNFYALTEGESTAIYDFDRFGEAVYGINLHNSYMTWALEGGLLVCLVVVVMFWRAGSRVRWIWKRERHVGVLLIAWCAAALLLGWFHQLHSTVQFWSILGVIFGYRDQLAASLPLAAMQPSRRPPQPRQQPSPSSSLPSQTQR